MRNDMRMEYKINEKRNYEYIVEIWFFAASLYNVKFMFDDVNWIVIDSLTEI